MMYTDEGRPHRRANRHFAGRLLAIMESYSQSKHVREQRPGEAGA